MKDREFFIVFSSIVILGALFFWFGILDISILGISRAYSVVIGFSAFISLIVLIPLFKKNPSDYT